MTVNQNICENCVEVSKRPSIVVADTGICGSCGRSGDVWDLEVIDIYKKAGLSDEMIWKYLPRLRSGHTPHQESRARSMTDIRSKLSDLLAQRD